MAGDGILTTTGRSSGLPRRIIIGPHRIDGRQYYWDPYGDRAHWYRNLVADPVVTVLPLRIESYKVYVVGKVHKPGVFTVPHAVNVMQALSMAGGATPFADVEDISILRTMPSGQERIPFDFEAVAKGKRLEQNIALASGDVVVVP